MILFDRNIIYNNNNNNNNNNSYWKTRPILSLRMHWHTYYEGVLISP